MSILNKYNKSVKLFNYEIGENPIYKTLKELYESDKEKVYIVKALYINTKSRFGESPVIATPEFLVNAPSHLVETVKQMRNDVETVDLINNDKAGFKIYQYEMNGKTYYSVNWIEF